MRSLAERLREALAPDYEVHHELAAGGMGTVFLARDVALDRRVAVKVLLPEIATEVAAQRFLREARILASLSHSHIIPVHHVGEANGLFYYVMDYMEGATLADALRRGPMSVGAAVKLGRDLLDALEEVHKRGIVHRDIKPANVFLLGRRALLGDFGIAKPQGGTEETLTQTGDVIGTPDYMPPEQISGHKVSAQTDVYTVAMVLYEAITGRRCNPGEEPSSADWSGVPGKIARVLRGALVFDPKNRWPDAATFRRKLWRTRVQRYQWRAAALTAGGIVAGGLLVWVILTLLTPSPVPGALVVRVEPFQQVGADPLRLTASVTALVARSLGQSTDFHVCEPDKSCKNATVTLHGTVSVSDSLLSVTVQTEDLFGLRPQRYAGWVGRTSQWRAGADSVAYDVLRTLWSQSSPLAEWLPLKALPTSTAGFNSWLEAERLFNDGLWGDAEKEYTTAARDSTCLLCIWRLREIGRQHPGAGASDTLVQHLIANKDSFPEHYQALIELESVAPLSERIAHLKRAAERWPDFFYLRFRWGEEIFNRGPLAGQRRAEALLRLQEALALRPGFAPALEHLAWGAIAEGEQENAERAFAGLKALPTPTDLFSGAYRLLIPIGFAYRFLGDEAGHDMAEFALGIEGIELLPEVVVAARLMPSFDAPNGAIDFGRLFEAKAEGDVRWKLAGLMGQMFGYLAMGQLDTARARARAIRGLELLDDFDLFAAQLDAFVLMFDEEGAGLERSEVMNALWQHVKGAAAPMEQKRAAWTLSLLQRQAGADSAADSMRELAGGQSDPLVILLDAHRLAVDSDLAGALQLADTLKHGERARSVSDGYVGPFFRTVVHLLRADWYANSNNLLAARQQLLWHQGWDQDGVPVAEPRVEEVDWGFGTLARWRRSMVLERLGDEGELCEMYDDIVRFWSKGDSVYAVRAKEARRKFAELGCEATSG